MINLEKKSYIEFKVYGVTNIKNKYGFRILLKYIDGSSNTIQKSGFKTKKEANAQREIAIAELHNNTFVFEKALTIKEFFTHWLENEMKSEITACSYDSYKNIVYNHIIPHFGNAKLSNINRGDIQKFLNKKTEYSHNIAKLCKTVINTAFNYAVSNKVLSTNVATDVNLPKQVKAKKYRTIEIDTKKTLKEEQVRLLINKAKGTPIYLQVLFAVLMGLRKQEINGLKYEDIDLIHRKIRIQRQLGTDTKVDKSCLKKGEYTKQEIDVKTFSSNRELDIPDILFEVILEEKAKYERNRSRRINDKTTPFKDYGFICCSTYGNPRSKSFHFKYWKQLLKECNLPDIRFHDLRATYCTLLVKNNFNLKAISKVMGHASEIISVDVYTDKDEIINDCIEEIEEFIKDVIPQKEDINEDEIMNDEEVHIINNFIAKII